MTITLKGGHETEDRRLDRIYMQDLRSLNFLVAARPEVGLIKKPRSYTWLLQQWLDQGAEGACVGFGYAHDLAARPAVVVGITDDYARMSLYYRFQREDPWPGGAYPGASPRYDGTAVLAGAKVCTDMGYYSGYDWALNASEVAQGIAYTGPAVLGLTWHEGMWDADSNGFIHPTGKVIGGHCICAVAVKIVWKSWHSRMFSQNWENVDMERSYITLHNSWGKSWGTNGRVKLSLAELDLLMKDNGEACFPRRNPKVKQIIL
jgi:hypothetical protein